MTAVLAVLAAGLASYLLRISLVAVGSDEPPAWLRRTTPYVMPAAFAGIAAASLSTTARHDGTGAIAPMAATITAAVVARRTGSTNAALGSALVVLWATAALV